LRKRVGGLGAEPDRAVGARLETGRQAVEMVEQQRVGLRLDVRAEALGEKERGEREGRDDSDGRAGDQPEAQRAAFDHGAPTRR
jgi:hypothetical protein